MGLYAWRLSDLTGSQPGSRQMSDQVRDLSGPAQGDLADRRAVANPPASFTSRVSAGSRTDIRCSDWEPVSGFEPLAVRLQGGCSAY